MASELRITTLANLAATESVDTTYVINGSARAWNNTNSAGTAINDSFNISSLTDVDTGRQDHNVSNSFVNGSHAPTFSVGNNWNQQWTGPIISSYWRTNNFTGSAYADDAVRTVSHGDLA
jgi:hypothetical protein